MLKPRHPVFCMAAIRTAALRWMWLCVSIRSNETSAARPAVMLATAGTIASNSRLVMLIDLPQQHSRRRTHRIPHPQPQKARSAHSQPFSAPRKTPELDGETPSRREKRKEDPAGKFPPLAPADAFSPPLGDRPIIRPIHPRPNVVR